MFLLFNGADLVRAAESSGMQQSAVLCPKV